MKNKTFSLLLVLFSSIALAQNWNVFNKNYRYNYKYDNSALVSQVLFADSVKQQGTDTVYYMNRIGFECTGNCPGFTSVLNPTTTAIIPNMPQFLQRSVKKLANGWTVLKDTAILVIKPNCVVNQSWLFDSVNNQTAVCVAKISRVLFGITDSVKNIIVGGTDTLVLSKRFGIVQFPNLYNKNKYYRLVGIENANSYDSTALYGAKVPNAWDFYNFDVGDKFCYSMQHYLKPRTYCYNGNFNVLSKTIVNDGYSYTVNNHYNLCSDTYNTPAFTNYPNLSLPSRENLMYPNQIIGITTWNPSFAPVNIVRFGLDSKGTFYKYAGYHCGNVTYNLFPFNATNAPAAIYGTSPQYTDNPVWAAAAAIYGTGLGNITFKYQYSSATDSYQACTTCALKKGSLYFGTETFVGVDELSNNDIHPFSIYPNPANDILNISFYSRQKEVVSLSIYNSYGHLVRAQEIDANTGNNTTTTDIREYASGVYLVTLKTSAGILKSKLIKE